MNKARLRCLFFCLLVFGPAGLQAQPKTDSVRVLFIGNSYTYGNDLPELLAQLMVGKGLKFGYESLTAEGTQALNHWVNYAQLGNRKIRGQFVRTTVPLVGADTYFEIRVDSTLGNLEPLSNTGNIQYRLAKTDWSAFNEANDHSYKAAAPMADNDRITVYNKGQLVYGIEPAPATGARLAANDEGIRLSAYPNPVNDYVTVRGGDPATNIEVTFYGVGGRAIRQERTRFEMPISVSQLAAGLYLLKVQAGQTVQYLKLVKQ